MSVLVGSVGAGALIQIPTTNPARIIALSAITVIEDYTAEGGGVVVHLSDKRCFTLEDDLATDFLAYVAATIAGTQQPTV
jgi:hypothetical protein